MDRRQFLLCSSLAATATMLPLKSLLAFRKGEFKGLRRNVGIFTERGGTIGWLASKDALVVIDSQYPETAKGCLKGLQDKTSHALDVLINTHHHGDHTNGNPVFKPVAEKIVAHKNVPGLMKQSAGEDEEASGIPTTTFSDSWKMDAGDEKVHATYYGRAHTSGDVVIYFEKANVVHMGDLVFNRMNPYTDRPAGASVHHWIKVLSTVMEEYPSDALYIFGHGNADYGVTGSREDVGVMKNYLSALVEHVEKGMEAGKSKKEITEKKKMEQFPNFTYADWWTLSQNLGVVYEEAMEM